MKKTLTFLLLSFMVGCAGSPRVSSLDPLAWEAPILVQDPEIPEVIVPVVDVPGEAPIKAPVPKGLVLGKTDFRGLLKTTYVRLTIVPRGQPDLASFFYVGSRANQSLLPWGKGEVIEPGYFTLVLAPGSYIITAIAIPVGSAIAEEPLSLGFDVVAGVVAYVGTLEINGTKERVKFGGVPLVQPGFEYELNVSDDFAGAEKDVVQILSRGDLPLVKKLLVQ